MATSCQGRLALLIRLAAIEEVDAAELDIVRDRVSELIEDEVEEAEEVELFLEWL